MEQHELTLSLVSDESFRDYLIFLSDTGARPQEARIVEGSHCQLDLNRIVLPPSNAKGKEDYHLNDRPLKGCESAVRFDGSFLLFNPFAGELQGTDCPR